MNSTDKTVVADIFCEFFEVVIHNILYKRKLYPDTIFVPKKKYGVVLYQCIHPEVSNYIVQCLKAVNFHAKKSQLRKIHVCFQTGDKLLERYVFDVLKLTNDFESDEFLVDLEQSLRNFILRLHTVGNYTDELPEDSTFTIQIQTTAYSSLEFNQEPLFEDFPWVELNKTETCDNTPKIVPLYTVQFEFLSLQIVIIMSGGGEGSGAIKRTSRLAVFEHIIEKEKPRKPKRCRPINRYYDSSPSESELIIDEFEDDVEPVKKKYKKIVKHSEEPLNLICDWDDCLQSFTDYEKFNKHINEHVSELRENDSCLWKDCTFDGSLTLSAKQHISHHGYLTKLKCIGNNVVERNNLPSCSVPDQYLFPSVLLPYLCEWEDCMLECETIYDFYMHIKCHIRNNPAQAKNGEIIQCFWRGCTSAKYSSQYKLAEHVRVHTKEKTIACPTCCTLFSNNTKFCDHRKRQLPTDLQSYQCSQCLKLFATERLLRDHMRSHINHYKCTMCDMTCPSPSILAKHMRHRHVKERFFTCNTCKKSFIEKHNLRTHLLTHMKENQMKCEICNYTCRTAYGLECHMVRDHDQPSSQVYECHCCKEVFTRGGYLTKHLMKVHNYHWPSGHSRFRYRQDQDGIFRLQTVRYESLEVTQEMIRSESLQTSQQISELSNHPSEVTIAYEGEELNKKVVVTSSNLPPQTENNSVLITVHDVDEEGNVLKSEVIEAKEIFYDNINLSVDGTQDENSVDIDDEELIKFHDPVPKAEK